MATTEVTSDTDAAITKYSPFISEVRKRLLFTIAIFIVFSVIGFFYYENIIKLLLKIFDLNGLNIAFTSPFQFYSLAMNVAILAGIVGVLPMAIFQFLAFLKPALKKSEYKTVILLLPLSLILFAAGFAFGAIIMKYVVVIFYQTKTLVLSCLTYLWNTTTSNRYIVLDFAVFTSCIAF